MRWMRWVLIAPVGVWAFFRVTGWDAWYPAVQLIAFTPYVAVLSVLVLALTVLWRQWDAIVTAGVISVLLAVCVLPRWLADSDPLAGANGVQLRVMTVNLLWGKAELTEVLRLAEGVDVLMVQELGPIYAAQLSPHFAYHVRGGEVGIFSRLPLREIGFRPSPHGFGQVTAELAGHNVMLESVHAVAPWKRSLVEGWRESYRRQQTAQPDGPMWILAGDFNATLDHGALRHLVRSGYRDAADVLGKGLTGTWGPYDGDLIPPVVLDRVLADRRIGVTDVQVLDVRGTDHRAVMATLVLP